MSLGPRPCDEPNKTRSCGAGGKGTVVGFNCSFCMDWVQGAKILFEKYCEKCERDRMQCGYFVRCASAGYCRWIVRKKKGKVKNGIR